MLVGLITALACIAECAVTDYYWKKAERKQKKKIKSLEYLLSMAAQKLNGVDDELVSQIQATIKQDGK